jgi:hypothetical protein
LPCAPRYRITIVLKKNWELSRYRTCLENKNAPAGEAFCSIQHDKNYVGLLRRRFLLRRVQLWRRRSHRVQNNDINRRHASTGNAVIIASGFSESMSFCMNTSIADALTLRASQQQSARTGKTSWPSVSISIQIPTTV